MAPENRPAQSDQAQSEQARLIARRVPKWRAEVVFDVGANIGQSARSFVQSWPEARIHCFEPVPSSFAKLTETARNLPQVTLHNLGFGRHSGTAEMTNLPQSVQNRIVAPGDSQPTQTVQILRGDAFCDDHGIRRISYLKIDTEGHDLEVLKGFGRMLKRVDFVQVEAGMNPYNKTHVPFEALTSFLTKRGFLLFHIFEQMMEFKKGGRPALRRCNPVYINASLVDLDGID